jgi:hypothetical protein
MDKRVGGGASKTLPPPLDSCARRLPHAGAGGTYTAKIPASGFKAGDMVRWAVAANAQGGAASRDPAPEEEMGAYKGTVIEAPRAAAALPALYWWAAGVAGTCCWRPAHEAGMGPALHCCLFFSFTTHQAAASHLLLNFQESGWLQNRLFYNGGGLLQAHSHSCPRPHPLHARPPTRTAPHTHSSPQGSPRTPSPPSPRPAPPAASSSAAPFTTRCTPAAEG